MFDLELHKEFRKRQYQHPNPLNKSKFFGFSQNEEDGITIEILKRIGLTSGTFVEFGVGDGTENNTIILLADGWKGSWFGGQDIALDTSRSSRLSFTKTWITKENIVDLYKSAGAASEVISLDLDGNDIYFVEELLKSGAEPQLFIVEYNAKFPPSIRFQIPYNDKHTWGYDDYFGASLRSFCDLFEKYGYMLVCCNISGANAFFVRNSCREKFSDVPTTLDEIYSEPFYFSRHRKMHPTSVETVQLLIEG